MEGPRIVPPNLPFERIRVHRQGGRADVVLARPDVHNAFEPGLIGELRTAFHNLSTDGDVRVVVLSGEGKSFCAGADLHWMKEMASFSMEENLEDAGGLVDLMNAIFECEKPVVARVHGSALGGGVGLVAACDLAVASESASFGLTEVRLGIVPAVIFPYVVRKVGISWMGELALGGERFSAARAREMGLVHRVVSDADLDVEVEKLVASLLLGGPQALRHTKEMLRQVPNMPLIEANAYTATLIAERRVSAEGQEGMSAFFGKRSPSWAPKPKSLLDA